MSKKDQMILFMAIEDVREELKKCETQLDMYRVHERLVTLYSCINTEELIDALADTFKRGAA